MFGIGTLFYAILFFINGIAVLSEDRFLARIGWSAKSNSNLQSNPINSPQYGYGDLNMYNNGNNGGDGVKARMINLINATRTLLRIPLIIVNILVILYELILG